MFETLLHPARSQQEGGRHPVSEELNQLLDSLSRRIVRVLERRSLMITTEAMVAELPKEEAPMGAPDMGGMGGMM